MNEVVGTKTTYFITQTEVETNEEQYVEYNAYTGSFSTSGGADMATRFDDQQQAVDLAELQNQISELLSRSFSYRVIEEVITRAEVGSEPNKEENTPE